MTHYSIGEFAKKTGLPISTLRYYEQEKLIYSHREKNNRRYRMDSIYYQTKKNGDVNKKICKNMRS